MSKLPFPLGHRMLLPQKLTWRPLFTLNTIYAQSPLAWDKDLTAMRSKLLSKQHGMRETSCSSHAYDLI